MNPRFLLLTFAAAVLMFGAVWALSGPRDASAPAAPVVGEVAVFYADCAAAEAAGAAPLHAGQPGYRAALDGNMNGIACEPVGGAPAQPVRRTDVPATTESAVNDEASPVPPSPAAQDGGGVVPSGPPAPRIDTTGLAPIPADMPPLQ